MKTKIYSESIAFLDKNKKKKVLEDMALVANALEKECYPYNIPPNSGSAHIFYNHSEKEAIPSNYLVNFFQETNPNQANVSRGYHKFFSEDLTDFIESDRASG